MSKELERALATEIALQVGKALNEYMTSSEVEQRIADQAITRSEFERNNNVISEKLARAEVYLRPGLEHVTKRVQEHDATLLSLSQENVHQCALLETLKRRADNCDNRDGNTLAYIARLENAYKETLDKYERLDLQRQETENRVAALQRQMSYVLEQVLRMKGGV
jgi:hypothetical protein